MVDSAVEFAQVGWDLEAKTGRGFAGGAGGRKGVRQLRAQTLWSSEPWAMMEDRRGKAAVQL